MKYSSHRRGFTLIELLAVLAVIAILIGLSISGLSYFQQKSAEDKTRMQLSLLSSAIEAFHTDTNEYPESDMLFKALSGNQPTGDQQIYLADLDPKTNPQDLVSGQDPDFFLIDAFGNKIIYRRSDHPDASNPDYDLCSLGKDGLPGTADDICL